VVDNMGLYRFQIAHKNLDGFVQMLMRAYGGLFEGYVNISELKLASLLKTDVPTVEKALKFLVMHAIVDYIPRQTNPSIVFLTERLPKENLHFAPEVYQAIKDRQRTKLQGIVNYCKQINICRSAQLLMYFDEKIQTKCGVCDVCTGRNTAAISPKIYENISKQIINRLTTTPIKITDLMKQISFGNRLQFTETLRTMIDDGVIQTTTDGQVLL
jgi:ATP-dependent DNA helicase RecQ